MPSPLRNISQKERVVPNFLLIGAQKAGTSWLARMMRQHPDVFIPEKKELHFFNLRPNYRKGMEWYLDHFTDYSGEKAVGECTPNYLWVDDAPDVIRKVWKENGGPTAQYVDHQDLIRNIPELVHTAFPELKLIVSLRNPVDRAVSSFFHCIRTRQISPRSRILELVGQNHILGMGFYYRHFLEWLKFFPRNRFLVLVYEEDVAQNKENTLRRVFRHLEVGEDFNPVNLETRFNQTPSHLYMYLNYYFPRIAPRIFRRVPYLHKIKYPTIQVTDGEREQLHRLYHDENRRLEELLDRSLAVWDPR